MGNDANQMIPKKRRKRRRKWTREAKEHAYKMKTALGEQRDVPFDLRKKPSPASIMNATQQNQNNKSKKDPIQAPRPHRRTNPAPCKPKKTNKNKRNAIRKTPKNESSQPAAVPSVIPPLTRPSNILTSSPMLPTMEHPTPFFFPIHPFYSNFSCFPVNTPSNLLSYFNPFSNHS